MYLGNAEVQKRSAFVDDIAEKLTTSLRTDAIRDALGHTATQLYYLADTLYLPNIHNGVISIPREHRGDGCVPILPVGLDEELRLDESSAPLSVVQVKNLLPIVEAENGLRCFASEDEFINQINNELRARRRSSDSKLLKSCYAQVFWACTPPLSWSPDWSIIGGGVVAINERPESHLRNAPDYGETHTVHELMHVAQGDARPVVMASNSAGYLDWVMRRELEATYVQALYYQTMEAQDIGYNDGVGTPRMEQLRALHGSKADTFQLTYDLKQALITEGILRFVREGSSHY